MIFQFGKKDGEDLQVHDLVSLDKGGNVVKATTDIVIGVYAGKSEEK